MHKVREHLSGSTKLLRLFSRLFLCKWAGSGKLASCDYCWLLERWSKRAQDLAQTTLCLAIPWYGPVAALQECWTTDQPPQNVFDCMNGFQQCLYTAGELPSEKLSGRQAKMKWLYVHRSELHCFSPGDQVLALLSVVGAPFQAMVTGPHWVIHKVSDTNYPIATPQRKWSFQKGKWSFLFDKAYS